MFSSIPLLPKYDDPLDKFSMYISVENQNGRHNLQWKRDLRLKSNFDLYQNRHPHFFSSCQQSDDAEKLALFWINLVLHNQPAKEEWEPNNRREFAWNHLMAYGEKACYWAAEAVSSEFPSNSWEEYLFLARCWIYEPQKLQPILAKYNPQISKIDTYLTSVLRTIIREQAVVGKFSRWRLLIKKSDKELKEALLREGRVESMISQLIFARKYFTKVYQMNKVQNPTLRKANKRLPEPDDKDFQEAANLFNLEKLLPAAPLEVSGIADINVEKFKAWMEICITALQNYPKSITPRFSLEALREAGWEVESESQLWQNSMDSEAESLEKMGNSFSEKTEAALTTQLLSLKPEQQKLVLLYYGTSLKHKHLKSILKISQGAISRRLSTIERKLLKTLSEISQCEHWVTDYVSGWLERSYRMPIYSDLIQQALIKGIKSLEPQEQEILQLCYGQKLLSQNIAEQMGISEQEVEERLRETRYKVEAALLKYIDEQIKIYTEAWLSRKLKPVVKFACRQLNISEINTSEEQEIAEIVEIAINKLKQLNN